MSRRYHMLKSILLFVFAVLLAQAAGAEDKLTYDRINLTAEAAGEVENDTLVAVLFAQREGGELAKLADEVNKAISQALKQAKQVSNVEVQTLDYQTNPVYSKQHITGWRVRQSLQVKSRDFQGASALIGELQNELAVESMSYEVSPVAQTKAEEALIEKAIAAFQQRAQNITRQLGRKTYRLVSMNVNTAGVPFQPALKRAAMSFSEAKVAAPVVEPGKQRVSVTVSGTIELVVN